LSDNNQGTIQGSSGGGVTGQHPSAPQLQLRVGPATSTEANTVQFPPVPILCWKVEDIRFAFDSSFVTCNPDNSPDPLTNPNDPTADPNAQAFSASTGDIRDELKLLASQIKQNPGCPLSVFGHADPVGPASDPDGYNKALAGRRATSIYALLISVTQPAKAASLWQTIAANPNEHWGSSQAQVMQTLTGLPAGTSMNNLISGYLPKLIPPEYSTLKIGPSNFLAQGADSQGKGDYQGCSSFNTLIIFSQQKEDSFAGADNPSSAAYAARNLANAPNRRVMVLIFTKGSKVDPAKWPCPSASDGYSGCVKRFWSDGQTRRTTRLPDQDRTFDNTHDTFACRFYQRLVNASPCEDSRVLNFMYGLQMTAYLPWSNSAQLRVFTQDGSRGQLFRMSDGQPAGDYLYFTFPVKPGIQYACEIRDGEILVSLFPPSELFALVDPKNQANTIPLFPPDSLPGQPGQPSEPSTGGAS
jgi:hypothetical protein